MFRLRNVTVMALVCVACTVLATTPAWARVVTVTATADTAIYEGTVGNGYSDYNFGASGWIYYGQAGVGGDQGGKILTKFSLPTMNPDEMVVSAIHSMAISTHSGILDGGATLDIYRLLSSWVEGDGVSSGGTTGATWNSRDKAGTALWAVPGAYGALDRAATPTDTISFAAPVPAQPHVVFDVTSDVAAMYAGTATNYGWLSQATNDLTTGYAGLGSRENAASYYYPILTVTFGPVPEPGTITLLTTGLLGLLAYAWRKRK